jgi:hypothetical protein
MRCLHSARIALSLWGLCLIVLVCFRKAPFASSAEIPRRIFLLEGLTPTQPAAWKTVEAFKNRLKQRTPRNRSIYGFS